MISAIVQTFSERYHDLAARRIQKKLTEGDINFLHQVEDVMPQYMEQNGLFCSLHFHRLKEFEDELWSTYGDELT